MVQDISYEKEAGHIITQLIGQTIRIKKKRDDVVAISNAIVTLHECSIFHIQNVCHNYLRIVVTKR